MGIFFHYEKDFHLREIGRIIDNIHEWEIKQNVFVYEITTALNNTDFDVRKAAITALGNLKESIVNSTPFIIPFLNSNDSRIRKLAEKTLIKIGQRAYNDLKCVENIVAETIEEEIRSLKQILGIIKSGNVEELSRTSETDKANICQFINKFYSENDKSITMEESDIVPFVHNRYNKIVESLCRLLKNKDFQTYNTKLSFSIMTENDNFNLKADLIKKTAEFEKETGHEISWQEYLKLGVFVCLIQIGEFLLDFLLEIVFSAFCKIVKGISKIWMDMLKELTKMIIEYTLSLLWGKNKKKAM